MNKLESYWCPLCGFETSIKHNKCPACNEKENEVYKQVPNIINKKGEKR